MQKIRQYLLSRWYAFYFESFDMFYAKAWLWKFYQSKVLHQFIKKRSNIKAESNNQFLKQKTSQESNTAALLKLRALLLQRVIGVQSAKRKIALFLPQNAVLLKAFEHEQIETRQFDLDDHFKVNARRLEFFEADILVAPPHILLKLAEAIEYYQFKFNLKQIFSPCTVFDAQDKRYITSKFGVQVEQLYFFHDCLIASTCNHGKLHFNEDLVKVEKHFLTSDQSRFQIAISSIIPFSKIINREKLDPVFVSGIACNCGSNFSFVERIESILTQTISLENSKGIFIPVYHDYLRRAVLTASDKIKFYSLVQKSRTHLECYLEVYEYGTYYDIKQKVVENLNRIFEYFDVVAVNLKFVLTDQSIYHGELVRIRNEWIDEDLDPVILSQKTEASPL